MKNISTKENLLTFFTLLLLSFLFCFNFLEEHFTIDTYILLQDGFYIYPKYALLPIGRIFSTLMFYFLDYLNISILTGIKLSSFLGIIICSITVFIIYKSFLKYFKNDFKIKLLIFMLSFFSIFNFSTIELFAYAESASMCLGLLCSSLASIVFTSHTIKHKYIYSQLLTFLATLCYQSTLSVFVILTLFHLCIAENNISKNIKKILICFVQYGIATIFNLLSIEIVLTLFDIPLYKISFEFSIQSIFTNFVYFSKALILDGLGIIPSFSYIIIISFILFIISFIVKKRKLSINYLINTLIIIISSYCITLLPMITMDVSDLYYSARMYIGTILIIPFFVIYIYLINTTESSSPNFKYKKIINLTCISFVVIFSMFNYIFFKVSTTHMLLSNDNDMKLANYILDQIDIYEQTNQKIIYIAPVYDTEPSFLYDNTTFSCVTRGFASEWSIPDILSYYGNREFIISENISTTIYDTYFKNKNWDNFSLEQLVFVGDTLYICIY